MVQKSHFHGPAEFSRFDRVTGRGCCGCYGWDIFNLKAVSESLKQMLQMSKKIIALSQSWQEWCASENGSRKPLFLVKKRIFAARPHVLSRLLRVNRSRYFQSVDCFWKFNGKTPHEKLFTTPAQSWTLQRPVENGCLKMPWFAPILGPLRPVFGTCYGKVVGMFFCKTAFWKLIFY